MVLTEGVCVRLGFARAIAEPNHLMDRKEKERCH